MANKERYTILDAMEKYEPNKTSISAKQCYKQKVINEKYYNITYQDEETKKARYQMWKEIQTNGKYVKTEYFGDYYIATYEYNNKYYELAENDDLGIMSYIKEFELEECE